MASPRRKAVFLDRDGTLTHDVVHCRRPDDLRLLPGAADAVGLLNRAGYATVLVTNQSVVARGYVTGDALREIHRKMERDLAQADARIDAIYCCPHHASDGCSCRKPRPGLILEAARDLELDLPGSFMVGNRYHDVDAAVSAGCRPVLVADELIREQPGENAPLYAAPTILDAARWIVEGAGAD